MGDWRCVVSPEIWSWSGFADSFVSDEEMRKDPGDFSWVGLSIGRISGGEVSRVGIWLKSAKVDKDFERSPSGLSALTSRSAIRSREGKSVTSCVVSTSLGRVSGTGSVRLSGIPMGVSSVSWIILRIGCATDTGL